RAVKLLLTEILKPSIVLSLVPSCMTVSVSSVLALDIAPTPLRGAIIHNDNVFDSGRFGEIMIAFSLLLIQASAPPIPLKFFFLVGGVVVLIIGIVIFAYKSYIKSDEPTTDDLS